MPVLPSRSPTAAYGLAVVAAAISADDSPEAQQGAPRVAESYAWCRRLTRASRSNFYLSFLTLPRALVRDVCVLYAFMRVTDDLGDDPAKSVGERSAAIDRWREQVAAALDGEGFFHPVLPALADIVRRHAIPREYLFDVIDGVKSDLEPRTFETFAQLADYCYHVAGAVGLCCLHIWGFSDAKAKSLAVDCGLAFQLTNILRDVAEDARVGRYYLPREDLVRFGLTSDNLRSGQPSAPVRELMAYEAARARTYFARAEDLVPLCRPAGRPILDAMLHTYAALLNAIEASAFDVHTRKIEVRRSRKIGIALAALWRQRRGRD